MPTPNNCGCADDPEARAIELAEIGLESWQTSVVNYKRAIELKPENREALGGLLRVTSLMGQNHESLGWSKELLLMLETNVGFWNKQLERSPMESSLVPCLSGEKMRLASLL